MFLQADLEDQVVMLKGKRSRTKRPRPPSSLELTTMAPTTSSSSTAAAAAGGGVTSDEFSDRTSTPSLSDSGELTHDEEQDMANCLILLARGQRQRMPLPPPPPPPGEVYQCKTCDKSFSSFQALGGHRASHKKPSSKPITITAVDEYYQRSIQISDNNNNSTIYLGNQTRPKSSTTTRVHECSLCGAEFASGQALGGHMRRHRPIPAASISGGGGHGDDQHREVKRQKNMLLSLDLNLPAAPEEEQPPVAAAAAESKFPFAPKEQVIVFSATPLVDCHY